MAQARPPLAYLSEITPQPTLPAIVAMGDQLNPYGLGTAAPTAANITAELALNRPDSTMQAYEPNWKDRWGAAIAGAPDQPYSGQRRALAEGLVGSSGLGQGEGRLSLADLAGVSGAVQLGQGIIGDREMLLPGAADVASNFLPMGKLAIFAGIGAKVADKSTLKLAQDMLAYGADRDDILKQTNWFLGPDKKWRFEIPDKASHFKGTAPLQELIDRRGGTLGDVFWHPEVYDAYPGAKAITVSPTASGSTRGTYSPGDILSDVTPEIRLRNANNPETRKTLLHEIQHYIQEQEGFARGGNTTGLSPGTPAWNVYQERLKAIRQPALEADLIRQGIVGPDYPYSEYLKQHKAALKGDSARMLDRSAQEYAVQNAYKRLTGEVEARNVSARSDMTPQQRVLTPPWKTQDIPEDQQFVRMLSNLRR